jgi:DUF1009 family protein
VLTRRQPTPAQLADVSFGWHIAKPNQDMRFDVPTVGPETIARLKAHGAVLLAVEAGKTVLLDRERMLADADAAGIVVLARTDDDAEVPPSSSR